MCVSLSYFCKLQWAAGLAAPVSPCGLRGECWLSALLSKCQTILLPNSSLLSPRYTELLSLLSPLWFITVLSSFCLLAILSPPSPLLPLHPFFLFLSLSVCLLLSFLPLSTYSFLSLSPNLSVPLASLFSPVLVFWFITVLSSFSSIFFIPFFLHSLHFLVFPLIGPFSACLRLCLLTEFNKI